MTGDRRTALRRDSDRIARTNRRLIIIIFMMAGVLYTVGFAIVGNQTGQIRDLTTDVCKKQELAVVATRALRPVIREALRTATPSKARQAATVDYLWQVDRLPDRSPQALALRDLGALIGRNGKPNDVTKLLDAEKQFLSITGKPAFEPVECPA